MTVERTRNGLRIWGSTAGVRSGADVHRTAASSAAPGLAPSVTFTGLRPYYRRRLKSGYTRLYFRGDGMRGGIDVTREQSDAITGDAAYTIRFT